MTQTHTYTDNQPLRLTQTHIDRQTMTHTHRHTHTQTQPEAAQTDTNTHRQTDKNTNNDTNIQTQPADTHMHTDRQTDRQTYLVQRRVFLGNQLHCCWQPNSLNKEKIHTNTQRTNTKTDDRRTIKRTILSLVCHRLNTKNPAQVKKQKYIQSLHINQQAPVQLQDLLISVCLWLCTIVLHNTAQNLSLIHIWRCRRSYACRSRWSPYH